ncbi:hypothetical protein [Sphingobium agri]|uniref:Uncharacterized protein n=1 Tax=Sphingobium agri TaxID=2933566 RepID=A0ABT0DWE0_9SPHN|nr:hypothetical protein [Sphingobium agri]MCK0531444.1 hypothetical protein [Sphingobium agri]
MSKFAYFNEYGDCLHVIEAAELPPGGVAVPDDTIPSNIWLNPETGEILPREDCPPLFADSYDVGDEIDFSVPAGAVALVNGEKVKGVRVFDTPQKVAVHIVGRYHLIKVIKIVSYVEQRAQAYPSIADQLDKLYHEGIDAWRAEIAAVKAQFPKV